MSGKSAVDGQLRLGLRSFLVRSRRGSVVGGALHLFFCVCWVFQGRITLGWRGLSMATSRWVSVYSCYGGSPIAVYTKNSIGEVNTLTLGPVTMLQVSA
jgi:hypothetical protein